MPPEVLPEAFACDEECADVDPKIDNNAESWFRHVLPQIRDRFIYCCLLHFILNPKNMVRQTLAGGHSTTWGNTLYARQPCSCNT